MMDFGTSAWDVSCEADQLTQSLFGTIGQAPGNNKRKRKSDSLKFEVSSKNNNGAKKARKRKKDGDSHQSTLTTNIIQASKFVRDNKSGAIPDDTDIPTKKEQTLKKAKRRKKKNKRDEQNFPSKTNELNVQTSNDQIKPENAMDKKSPIMSKKSKSRKKKQKLKASLEKKVNEESDRSGNEKTVNNNNAEKGIMKEKMILSSTSKQGKHSSVDTETETGQLAQEKKEGHTCKKKKGKRKCKKNKFKDFSQEGIETCDSKLANGQANEPVTSKGDSTEKSEAFFTKRKADVLSKTSKIDVDPRKKEEQSKSMSGKKLKQNQKTKQTGEEFGPAMKGISTVSSNKNKHQKSKSLFDPAKLESLLSVSKQESEKNITKSNEKSPEKQNPKTSYSVEESSKPMTLLQKSKERLKAARFRYINEQLYTSTGHEALAMFKEDGEAFQVYHEGFQSQVEKWPVNPIDLIIEFVKNRPKNHVVADFGCGEAKLARSVTNKVHSFDLVALNEKVTVCDMSKVPLKDSSVDVAVFCLSLMGTNLPSYLQEANRVLKQGGMMKIAEVTSRFHGLGSFIVKVEKMGFKIKNQDSSNKMFVMMDFKKTSDIKSKSQHEIHLSPCVYKKR